MHIHHVGYLVKKLEKARAVFSALGYTEKGAAVYDEYRDVNILFMEKDGYTIELVSPKSERSVVAELIKKYKNAPYHICYVSDDLEADREKMSRGGFTGIDEPAPAPALGGQRVCFFMNPYIGMVELMEETDQ